MYVFYFTCIMYCSWLYCAVDLTDDGNDIEKEIVRLKARVAALERQVAAKNGPNTLSFNVSVYDFKE